MVEQVWEGIDYDYPALTVIEFNDDRKIQRMRSYYDKLGLEQRSRRRPRDLEDGSSGT